MCLFFESGLVQKGVLGDAFNENKTSELRNSEILN